MKSFFAKFYFGICTALITLCAIAEDPPYKAYTFSDYYYLDIFEIRLKEVLPLDAANYISLYRSCKHWGGEPTTNDEERNKQISDGIEDSCTGLKKIKKSIDTKYKNKTSVMQLIRTSAKEIDDLQTYPSFVFNDPLRKSIILNVYFEAKAQYVIRTANEQLLKYQAIIEKLHIETNKPQKNTLDGLELVKFTLGVQKSYLIDVLKNIDRLHPITREQIKQIESKLMGFKVV